LHYPRLDLLRLGQLRFERGDLSINVAQYSGDISTPGWTMLSKTSATVRINDHLSFCSCFLNQGKYLKVNTINSRKFFWLS
jgi:hypothetical protein